MKKVKFYTWLCLLLLVVGCCTLLLSCEQAPCAEGHMAVTDAAVAASCTQKGLTEGSHCSVCNAILVKQEPVAHTAHTPGEWQTLLSPSCTQKGSRYQACTVCNSILTVEEIATTAHTFADWTVVSEATCSGAGERRSTCEICHTAQTEAIPATTHTPGDWITDVAVGCTTKGARHKACTICGQITTRETVTPGGHSFGTPTVTRPASCTENGLQDHTCTACGFGESTVILATGHTLGTPVTVVNATCTEDGVQHVFCTVCESQTPVAVMAIPSSGHSHSTWQQLTAATCTTPGVEASTCTACGASERREIPAIAHSTAVWTATLAATADTAGLEKGSCPTCHLDLGTRYTNPLNASTGFTVKTSPNGTCKIDSLGTCTDTRLIIPCYIDEYLVTEINSLGSGSTVTDIVIPPSVTSVSSAIRNQTGLVRTENGVRYAGKWVVGFTEDIPAVPTLREDTVGLASSAFANCQTLTGITLPASLKYIGSEVFSHTAITSFCLPRSVASVGSAIFLDCTALSTITAEAGNATYTAAGNCLIHTASKTLVAGCKSSSIPRDGSVTAIGSYALFRSGLTALVIPASVTQIAPGALGGLGDLVIITVLSGNTTYKVQNNCLIDIETQTVVAATKKATIPTDGSVTRIGQDAFSYHPHTAITIPSTVTHIDSRAFRYCTALESVSFSNGSTLESIGSQAFYYCTALESLSLPAQLQSIGNNAFQSCTSLRGTLELPQGLKTIGEYAFNNTKIYTLIIPASVISIGRNAFTGCYKLVQIRKLSSVTLTAGTHYTNLSSYSQQIRQGTTASTAFSYAISTDANGYVLFKVSDSVKYLLDYVGSSTVIAPTGSTFNRVYPYAFYNNKQITSVTLPTSITRIETYAFYGCSALETLTLNANLYTFNQNALRGCTAIKTATVPTVCLKALPTASLVSLTVNGGKEIEGYTLTDCPTLTTLVLPSSLYIMRAGAFSNCPNLKTATLPVTALVNFPKEYIENLTIIKGRKYIDNKKTSADNTTIPSYAFKDCMTLKSVHISPDITLINGQAFYNCDALKEVVFDDIQNSKLTELKANTFSSCQNLETLVLPEGPTTIPGQFLHSCESITSFVIPSTVTTIGYEAFYCCYALTSITIPKGVTMMESRTPNSPQDRGTFSYCYALKTVIFEAGSKLTHIPHNAFLNCTKLESISAIPATVTVIGKNAFKGCSKLSSISFENPNGWRAYDATKCTYTVTDFTPNSGNSGVALTLSNTTTIATYLTSTYANYFWRRS